MFSWRRISIRIMLLVIFSLGGVLISLLATKADEQTISSLPTRFESDDAGQLAVRSEVLNGSNYSIYFPAMQKLDQNGQPFKLYLPQISHTMPLATRVGYAAVYSDAYSTIADLRAGWYLNYGVQEKPTRPGGAEFVQMIRVNQAMDESVQFFKNGEWIPCAITVTSNRVLCPYQVPHTYVYRPSASAIQKAAKANPGSLWLIGNEIERLVYQDEILPETYAVAYHDLYDLIKQADPTAKVAIGGVIQATPLRLQYLQRVWVEYLAKYGVEIPVDVWNIHTMILPEARNQWGADIPAGIDDVSEGTYIFRRDPNNPQRPESDMPEHISVSLVDEQVRVFRQWMKEHGQQEKPLIVSEYGVLLPNWVIRATDDDPKPAADYMLATFDYFLDTKDCNLGYTSDDCRLIQRWVWYNLDDNPSHAGFNPYSALINSQDGKLTYAGEVFRDYVRQHLTDLMRKPY